jgi:hypothetical protein
LQLTGSLDVSQGITGSLFGTASYALEALTSSYAATASYVLPLNQNVEITGSLSVTGSNIVFKPDYFQLYYGNTVLIDGSPSGIVISDTIGSQSADFENRYLKDATNGNLSVDWNTRQLLKSDGTTVSVDWENGIFTGSLFGTASYAQTASYVNPLTQDVSITGSLYVSSSATSIFINTLPNDIVTEFVAGDSGVVDFSYLNPGSSVIKIRPQDALIQGQNVSYLTIRGATAKVKIDTDNASNDVELQPTIGNVAIGKTSANSKLDVNGNVIITGSLTVTQDITGSLFGTASWAVSSSHAVNALTSSYSLNSGLLEGSDRAVFITTGSTDTNQTINGSLTISQNLTVLGSSSIQYITSSQLIIADNIISVNTINPGVRFGGISVIDSGSSPQTSGSLLFDSQNNQWIYVHQSSAASAVTSSVLIMGPQTFNNIGNETTITVNKLTKGTGGDLGEHIGDSNITDTGTVVSINSNTQLTGSLVVSQTITGSILNISSTPTLNNTNSQILTRNSTTGQVEYSTQASAYIFNYGIANAFINQNYLT